MTDRERIEALEAEITELRFKVAQLEAQQAAGVVHHHHHYPAPLPAPAPSPTPWQPYVSPTIAPPPPLYPNICQASQDATQNGVMLNAGATL